MAETPRSEVPVGYVRFWSFAASEFEDEELFYCAARIAKAENRTHKEVEKEFAEKLRYVRGKGQHPFETWGPQELADRLNAYQNIEIDP